MNKNYLLALCVAASLFACNGATDSKNEAASLDSTSNKVNTHEVVNVENAPVLSFEEVEHDFGTITEGDKVEYTFKFTNTGKSNLIIDNASAQCGCTIPNWPKEPIAPGAKGEIHVEFNSAHKSGLTNKVVTVNANTIPSATTVKIIANIKDKK